VAREYLFDPADVDSVLGDLPNLRGRLGDPQSEGVASRAFPQARKSRRELFRLITGRHYEHIDSLVRLLDRCLASGVSQPRLLQTSGRGDFPSLVAELLAAGWLLDRGLSVRGFDEGKGQESVPDLLAERGDLRAHVEVYRPRDWEGLDALRDELRLALEHLDEPFDYRFDIDLTQLRQFEGDRLVWLDPWLVSQEFEKPGRRECFIAEVVEELVPQLRNGGARATVRRELDARNLGVTVELHAIESASGELPVRCGVCGGPGLTGYAPEAMFDRLVERRVLPKARERQTRAADSSTVEVLLVDVTALGCRPEFSSQIYLSKFAESADRHLHEGSHALDAIAFVEPQLPDLRLRTRLVVLRTSLGEHGAEALLGPLRPVAP
jgi:hypothetical protein